MRYNNQAGLLHQCERKGPPPKNKRKKEKKKSGGERGRTRDQRAMEESKNQMKTAKAKLKAISLWPLPWLLVKNYYIEWNIYVASSCMSLQGGRIYWQGGGKSLMTVVSAGANRYCKNGREAENAVLSICAKSYNTSPSVPAHRDLGTQFLSLDIRFCRS